MTLPSPICSLNAGSVPANVTAASTPTIALANATGAKFWSVVAVSTDETNTAAAINASLSINQTNKTATFTAPAVGSAVVFESTVGINGLGLDANNFSNPLLTTTFKVNVLCGNGLAVFATNETFEQSAAFGWIATINNQIRATSVGGTGVGSLHQDVLSDLSGTAKVVGSATVPIDLTSPLAMQTQVFGSKSSSVYGLASVEQVLHVDTYIAAASANSGSPTVSQQLTGIQNALNAFATATQSNSAQELVFGAKSYGELTAGLKCVGAIGGTIRGAGLAQSSISFVASLTHTFQLVNCQFTHVRDLKILSDALATTLQGGGAIAGATTITLAAAIGIVNGQTITLWVTPAGALAYGEVVTVVSGGGTTSLTISALRNTYAAGTAIWTNCTNGFESYSDIAQTGPQPGSLHFENCVASNFAHGFAANCSGGSGSSSDHGNDGHLLSRCQTIGAQAVIAGLHIGHVNAEAINLYSCEMQSIYGVECLTGGCFSVFGGEWAISGYAITLGGLINQAVNIYDLHTSDNYGGLIQARASDAMLYAQVNFFGMFDLNTTSSTDVLLMDVTGTQFRINVTNSFLSAGAGAGAYKLYFKDSALNLGSVVTIENTELGAYGGTADGVLVIRRNSPYANHGDGLLHEAVANGGQWAVETGGFVNNPVNTGVERFGQLTGRVVLQNTITTAASPYTADSGALPDHTVRVDNTGGPKTFVIPNNVVRAGREFVLEALSAGNAITIDAPTTSPTASTINGGSSVVWTPTQAYGRVTIALADTLTSGFLATWTVDTSGGGSGSALPSTGVDAVTLTNGSNNNVAVTNETVVATGPSASYSVTGFSPPTGAPMPGQRLDVIFEIPSQALTLVHNNTGGGTSTYPLLIATAANVTVTPGASGYASFRFRFDGTAWRQV